MLGSLLGEIKGFFIIKQIEKLWLLCFCFNFHVSKIWVPAQRACWNNIYKSSEFTFRPAVPSYEALGVEDPNIVPDAQITASSNYLSYYPRKGRLNGDSGWCQQSSKITDNYIQVDMGAGRTVCGVATQGKANDRLWKATGSRFLLMAPVGLHIKSRTSKRYNTWRSLFSTLSILSLH